MGHFRELKVNVADRTIKELLIMVLINFVAFLVLKILCSLVSM